MKKNLPIPPAAASRATGHFNRILPNLLTVGDLHARVRARLGARRFEHEHQEN
jgi:hypothetical protein